MLDNFCKEAKKKNCFSGFASFFLKYKILANPMKILKKENFMVPSQYFSDRVKE